VDNWRPAGTKFDKIIVGDAWKAAGNWDFEKTYQKKSEKKE
jgi:hypothetical protein